MDDNFKVIYKILTAFERSLDADVNTLCKRHCQKQQPVLL